MSKEINNREYRQQVIRNLLKQLHEGKTADEVKEQFEQAFSGVSVSEISEAEQALIAGGLPVAEVQRLCDVHAAVFKGSIEEIHKEVDPADQPGHPVHTLKLENRALEALIQNEVLPHADAYAKKGDDAARHALTDSLTRLYQLDAHYLKKENLLFPYMERYGITAPPKVMWGVDDEIRAMIKAATKAVGDTQTYGADAAQKVREACEKANEMIFKEENILFPMLMETLTQQEWAKIASEYEELGFCLIDPPPAWQMPAAQQAPAEAPPAPPLDGAVILPTGNLSLAQLTGLLNALPVDITFVDDQDTVRYFSQGTERVFPRTKAIIGRQVIHCHPPASMHIVQQILDDFKSGAKSHEDFWIDMRGKYILIRYYAVRDEQGKYMGTLEVTQDIAPIKAITGEKRLMSE